ncbi:DNA-directed RNA polymerase subunit delta [Mesomycoplasma hyorhinis]|uniref:DNA-directed RNA polymerase subunit delta n=1 Tax=Mesomycoplasma hyorhinis TaxID=2100 RepID=UPI001C03F28D|nr:DNA-directed RNA polymerase subunit delta [Mesomycoplasma hyorhinis]
MKTLITAAIEALKLNSQLSFNDLFNSILKDFLPKWKEELPNLSFDEILIRKKGELYKLLTVDGNFTMVGDNVWKLRHNFGNH